MSDITYLGTDLGASALKLYGAGGGIQLPTVVAPAQGQAMARLAGLGQTRPPLHIHCAAGDFWVGDGASDWGRPVENLDHDRFAGAPELRALLYGGLTRQIQAYAPLAGPVELTVGLPLETLTGSQAEVDETVAGVRRWLTGSHTWEADGAPFTIEVASARISSQPVGALMDFLLDDQGAFIPARRALFSRELGIISVGMNTVELLVVRDGAPVQRLTAGQRVGVRRLLELLNPGSLYTLGELDAQLRRGQLPTGHALPIWASEVGGVIERRWGTDLRRFAAVVVVGGGALLLGDALLQRLHGMAWLPDDPVLATARGLYKFARQRAARRRARE